MTLIELMVAMSLLVIVGPIITSVMISTMSAGKATEDQSRVIDEMRQQMYAISRELRSANCIYIPDPNVLPSVAGNTLRFSTDSQVGSSSTTSYVQYQVVSSQLVRTQYADSTFSDPPTGTRYVGPGLVSPNTTFQLVSTPRKSVIVVLKLQFGSRPVQQLTTTIAGRNAWSAC
jgi:type II secretory pathway pseudopilin PulG